MLPRYKSAVPWASAGVWVVPFVQFYVFPRASPSGIHKTALRVQIPYTLEAHGTTIICRLEAGEVAFF